MAFDDDGTWNQVAIGMPMGSQTIPIAALTTAMQPTGVETQVQFLWNGELLDLGVLRLRVK